MENHNLPWTNAGRELLSKIEGIIDANGGIETYAKMVESELNLSQYAKRKRELNQMFDKIIKYKMNMSDAAELLGMNRSEFKKNYYDYLHAVDMKSNIPVNDT